jgi:SPP1 gp7 family putative phage head morphogenesis protein
MEIRDRGAWIKWQKEKEPPSKWLKSEMKRRQNRVQPFSKPQLETRCLTGYSKWYNYGQYARGYDDPNVEAWAISAIRDGHECLVCRALDKTIRPKTDDAFWAKYCPPIHWKCRCRLVSIVKGEDWKATVKSYFQGLNPQQGFGGTAKKMDVPARFKTAKRLEPQAPGI